MIPGLKLITAPTIKPISLAEAKAHLRVDGTDEDSVISLLIDVATAHVDGPNGFLGRALVDQTWEMDLDSFPGALSDVSFATPPTQTQTTIATNTIKIPVPPLLSVVSISYSDTAGNSQTYSAANYTVDTVSEPGRIIPKSSWPSTFSTGINNVRVQFRAGYINTGVSPNTGFIPADIKGALLLLIGALYANREEVVDGRPVVLPWGADALLRRRRVDLSMA